MNEVSINQKQNVPPQKNATSALKSLFLKDIRLIRRPKLSNSGEQVGYLVVRGREALQVPRRLESAHRLLAHARGLVRVLGPIVQALVLAMLDVDAESLSRRLHQHVEHRTWARVLPKLSRDAPPLFDLR